MAKGRKPAYRELDCIAYGVEIRYDLITGHTQVVIQETARIAQDLGIPAEQIVKWVKKRQRKFMRQVHDMDSILERLQKSPVARLLFGITMPHRFDDINSNKN